MNNFNEYHIINPHGSITTIEECRLFFGFIRELLQTDRRNILLDFSSISEISGSLSGFLSELITSAASDNGNLVIANAKGMTREILESTGFSERLIGGTIPPPSNENRILLVEDDEGVRDMTREYLSDFGYEVTTASDGFSGFLKWSMLRNHLQLVLSDIEMPRMDGLGLLTTVLAEHPGMPFVMMTGYARSDKIRRIQTLRPQTRILTKPFMAEQLEKAILTEFQNTVN